MCCTFGYRFEATEKGFYERTLTGWLSVHTASTNGPGASISHMVDLTIESSVSE